MDQVTRAALDNAPEDVRLAAAELVAQQKILKDRAKALGIPSTEFAHTLGFITRKMEGGRERFIQFVALGASIGDEDCRRFLHAYEELPKWQQKSRIGLDLLALSIGIQPVTILRAVVGVAFEAQVDAARMIALASQPDVMSAAVESAKRLDSQIGLRDRHALLQSAGVLPTPKGSTINIGVTANAQAQSTAAAAAASSSPNIPSFVADMDVVSGVRETVQRQLLTEGVAPEPLIFTDQEREHAPIDVNPSAVE